MADNEKILDELKEMRLEIQKNQEENARKIEEIQKNLDEKTEIQAKFRREMLEMFSENQKKIEEKLKKIETAPPSAPPLYEEIGELPIRLAILGTWKMVSHENFESYQQCTGRSVENFSENVRFWLENGKLRQSGGDYRLLAEGRECYGTRDLDEKDNHLKTFRSQGCTVDRHIEGGRLHVVHKYHGHVWLQIYRKI